MKRNFQIIKKDIYFNSIFLWILLKSNAELLFTILVRG